MNAATIVKANNTTRIDSATSWVGGVAPGAADILLFDSTITGALTTATQTSNFSTGAIQVTSIGGPLTIGMGLTMTLNNNLTYAIDMSAATADVTIGATTGSGTLRWASAETGGINVAAGRTLTVNSNFTNNGNTKTIVMTGGGSIIFNGSAGSGGAAGFSVQGGSTVTMNGTGGWSGSSAKEVISGTLNLGSDTALGSITALNLGGTNANTPTLAATGGARAITNGITLLATSLGGNPTITGSNALTIGGTLTNSGASRTLSVNNTALTTFNGAVALSEGATNRTLTINGTGNVTISGVVGNGGTATASSLTYAGAGLLSLSNANTFAGTLTASSGTARIDNTLAAQNATVSLGAANAVTFGTGITSATFGALSGTGDLALTNTDTNAVALAIGGNNVSTSYSGALSGAGTLTKSGTGTQTLSGAVTTGDVTVNAGQLTVSSTSNTSNFIVQTGATLNGGGTSSNTNGGLGTGSITFKGGTLSSAMGTSNTLVVGNSIIVGTGDTGTFNTTNRLNWSGNVTGGGTFNANVNTTVTRLDLNNNWAGFTGTLNLTGSGGIRLFNNGGTFNTGSFANTTMNLGGSVTLNPQTNSGGNTYPIGSLEGSSATAALNGGTSGRATYSVGALNNTTTYAGTINGNAALIKTGTGTLTITGTNTYSGTTTVSGGALQVGNAGGGTTGTGTVTIQDGAAIFGTGTVTGGSFTVLNGAIIQAGDSTAASSYGALSFAPAISGGTFDFQSGSNTILGTNPGGVGDLLTFTGDGTQTLLFNGNLTVGPSSFTPLAPEVFNLLDWSGVSAATFHSRYLSSSYSGYLLGNGDDNLGFDLPNISGSGFVWDISSFTTNGTIAIVAVPEPSRAMLLMLGSAALFRRRRLPLR